MEHIRIGQTDIMFEDIDVGKGKIIISDNEFGYDFSCHWGSMGEAATLVDFIKSINSHYFVKSLSHKFKGPMNVKKTFVNLRAHIQEGFEHELEWYEHLEFQKDFRRKLKQLQKEVGDDVEFIQKVSAFHTKLDFSLIKDRQESNAMEDLFASIFKQSEPWRLVHYETHPEDVFLSKLHSKLKKSLSKPVQLCLL